MSSLRSSDDTHTECKLDDLLLAMDAEACNGSHARATGSRWARDRER